MAPTTHEQIRHLVNDRGLGRPLSHDLVERLFAERPGSVCVDIGANVGKYVGYCLERGASLVHAFEPVPWVFDALTTAWGHDSRVRLHKLAISDRAETRRGCRIHNAHTLAVPGELARPLALALEDKGAFDFESTTLDRYFDSETSHVVDFIKLDVDGYEPRALAGMARTLAQCRPIVMIELSFLPKALGDNCEAMIDGIYRAGYKLCTMDGYVCEDQLIVLEAFPWRSSFDMVMVPVERVRAEWPRIR